MPTDTWFLQQHRFVAVDHRGVDARDRAADLVLLFVALGTDLDSHLRAALPRPARRRVPGGDRQVFLPERAGFRILFYGFSFLYGSAGSTEFRPCGPCWKARSACRRGSRPSRGWRWCWSSRACVSRSPPCRSILRPDVYQAPPTQRGAAVGGAQGGGTGGPGAILVGPMPGMEPYAWSMVLVISVLTMTLANVTALWQNDLRRLLAYSSIAHAGYMLMAWRWRLAAGGAAASGTASAPCGSTGHLRRGHDRGVCRCWNTWADPNAGWTPSTSWPAWDGPVPLAAAVLAVCMFSLAGVPPLAGFWGKLLVFGSALNVERRRGAASMRWWFIAAAVIGVINAAVAAAYYLRIVAVMYFRTPLATPRAQGGAGAWWAAVACALLAYWHWSLSRSLDARRQYPASAAYRIGRGPKLTSPMVSYPASLRRAFSKGTPHIISKAILCLN